MSKKDKKINFNQYVKNKKLPILTLDARWHELFPDGEKSAQIKELEAKVNQLLKKQGKLVNDIKDMKCLKNNLLKDIVVNMDTGSNSTGKVKEKKLEKNKQYINELNEKLNKSMDDLADIPYLIKEANEELMTESMRICYDRMSNNNEELGKISEWITRMRDELKEKILLKQDMESVNTMIYTYMHDLLGAELMQIFDEIHNVKPNS